MRVPDALDPPVPPTFREVVRDRVHAAMNKANLEWTYLECHAMVNVIDDISNNFGMYATAWKECDR